MSGDCVVIQKMEGVVKSSKAPGALKKKLPKTVAGISPPPIKKLKQGRLPFKPLETKPQQLPAIISPNTKKRKLSDPLSGPQKACKSKRSEENCTQAEPSKKVDDADNEVSSSSEPNVDDKNSKKRNFSGGKPKPIGLIEKFLKTTQQLEVTTSCMQDEESETAEEVIDLTDSQASKKVNDADDEKGSEPGELKSEPTESCVDENLNVSDKKQTDDSQFKEKDADDDKQRNSADPCLDEKFDDKDETSEPNPEAAAEDPDSTGAEEDTEQSEDEAKEDEDNAASHFSEKSKSPENSPTANIITTTPCSAKRSRTKLPLSSEKKAKREAERQKREEEKERLRQEKLKAKEEKERLKREEKEKKEQEKAEAKLKKEKEKLEKQEQKEKERKLKEEEQKKKEEEKKKLKEAAEAEKKKKEEERKKKEDEKKKREEEKQKIEEEKIRKKQKEQSAFQSFFTKSNKEILQAPKPQSSGRFVGFQIKDDMRLAPTIRVEASVREEKAASLDKAIQDQCSELYLNELKAGKIQKGYAGKTWPWSLEKDLVEISGDEPVGKTMRTKFLKFKENYRPPYYGTWRKRSSKIRPRRPLEKDEDLLDYEVDSDDEWEEEEPGESLSNSEGEDEEKEDNDEEEEDGFFVPHGYLSEGEGCEDDEEDVSPEALKARQVAKARAWDADMKKKCEVLKPICLGCCWVLPDVPRDPTFEALSQFKVVSLVETSMPIPVKKAAKKAESSENEKNKDEKDWKSKILKPVPEEAMADLIQLVHGNVQSSKKLIREFRVYWQRKSPSSPPNPPADQEADKSGKNDKDASNKTDGSLEASQEKQCAISKRQLEMKLKEIAVYEKQQGFNKICWYVKKPVLEKYKLTDLPVPTQWQWITVVKEKHRTNSPKSTAAQTPTSGKKTSTIKHFTKEVSPTKLFSPNTPKSAPRTTPNASSPATPCGQAGIRTPTQRKTPSQGVKTTPTIKQFAVPQASPFRVKTPGTPKSVPSPHAPDMGSPLAMLMKSSPKTTPVRRAQQQNAKKLDAAASDDVVYVDHGSKQAQIGSETNHTSSENTNNTRNDKAQPTLLALLNKAALPEDDCISKPTSSKSSEDKHSNDKIEPTTDAITSSSVRGSGTAEEPMEID